MSDHLKSRLAWMAFLLLSGVAGAAETLTALNMVTADAAFCLEIPHLDQTWKQVDSSALMQRVRSLPVFKRMLESPGYQHWQEMNEKVAAHTGRTITSQLRALFGNSLVLAIYIPENGEPKGILMGEALDATAVETALSTWNAIDPSSAVTVKTVQGHKYHQRKKQGSDNLFYASTDRWFAISDQENLIQDVILKFTGLNKTTGPGSLKDSSQFQKNRQRLSADAAAYVYINARPWDRGLADAQRDDHDLICAAEIWKHVRSISGCLDLRSGVVCDAVVEIDAKNPPSQWAQLVSTASKDPAWDRRIPSDVLLAISGHVELASVLNGLLNQTPSDARAELEKNRRIAQSILGGQELFSVVAPTLAKDFSGTIAVRTDSSSSKCTLDGSVSFTVNSPGDVRMLQDVARGLETGLGILAAYFSAEGQGVVKVQHEQSDSSQLSWLSDPAPLPVAYGLKHQTLVIAASPDRVRKMLDLITNAERSSRLNDHARRYFPKANQLVWLDAAKVRETLDRHGPELAQQFSHGSLQEEQRFKYRFEQVQPYFGLVDSLFVAGRIESDSIHVTLGGGLDANRVAGSVQR